MRGLIDPPRGAAPVGEAEAGQLFSPLAGAGGVLVAVSGGPDSTALMALMARWASRPGRPPVIAATVDHGLRPSSADEARAVARAAADLGLTHHTLTWTGDKPSTGIQEAARAARYRLLSACARDCGATHLVTAHTLDDQAETALIRLARGTGLNGLAAMRTAIERDGLLHVRPFLTLAKARLVATCDALGAFYLHDPSNEDPRFARARWRRLMPALAAEGLTAERLAMLASRAARIEEALQDQAASLLAGSRRPGGLDLSGWAAAPFEIAVRTLSLALAEAGTPAGGPAAPRLARIEALASTLVEAAGQGRAVRRTIAGHVADLDAAGLLRLRREGERRRGMRKPFREVEGRDAAAPLATPGANHKLDAARDRGAGSAFAGQES